MIVRDNGAFYIPGWEEHQNAEALEKIRENTRKRVAKHREKQKLLSCNVTCNVTERYSNATDKEKDIKNKKKILYIPLLKKRIALPLCWKM